VQELGPKHVGGAHTQPDVPLGNVKNTHVSSLGQKPPHVGPPPGAPV